MGKEFTKCNPLESNGKVDWDLDKVADRQTDIHTRPIFSAIKSYCSHISVVLLSYDSRSTLIRRDSWESIVGYLNTLPKRAYFTTYFERTDKYIAVGFQLVYGFLVTHSNFSQPSCYIRVDLLSYESKTIYKWEQYDWRAEKKIRREWDGMAWVGREWGTLA